MATLEDAQLQMEQVEHLLATIMDEHAAAQDAWENSGESSSVEKEAQDGGERLGSASACAEEQEEKQEDNDEEEEDEAVADDVARSPTLSLALLESDGRPVQWNLISPWSEADEDDEEHEEDVGAHEPSPLRLCTESPRASPPPTVEPEAELQIEERLRELIRSESAGLCGERAELPLAWDVDANEDDEEFEVFSRPAVVASIDELFEEETLGAAHEEEDNCDARTSAASTFDDSCEDSPRQSAASRFLPRRLRAQSHTGTATTATSMQSAFAKFRSRTLSATRPSFRSVSQASSTSTSEMDDAGDFTANERAGSFSRHVLTSRLGSVGSLKQMAAGRMSFLRFRSSSATTTTSEDSFYTDSAGASGSPLDKAEVHSAPSLSAISNSTTVSHHHHQQQQQQQQQQSNHLQMHALKLKASAAASKAAVYLNAASSEAARKIKSRTLRSPAKTEDERREVASPEVPCTLPSA